ncbi:SRPBCC family protein [Luteimonas salinilitoris]|uniref:SRPBCC family protein n=1 Tax=Luteimonas salinilitoris TaxID=3237697 RepID=A0ABV4HQE5_9GAMM
MNDAYAELTASDTVRIERLLPGPIERVWAWLTEPDKRRQWLAGGGMELRVGGAVELRFRHAELSPVQGPVPERYREMHENGHVNHGRVTTCDPPRRLAYTWGDTGDDASEVAFELSPQGDRVLLVLTHRRLQRSDMASVASGWHAHLCILLDRLHDRLPANFWIAHTRLEREYAKRLPAA